MIRETGTQCHRDALTSVAASRISRDKARPEADPAPKLAVLPKSAWYIPLKAATDFFLGFLLLIATTPAMLIAAILIKLTSRGPIVYRQVRLGTNGRPYTIYKLRTMVDKAEALTGPVWSSKDDARVTPLGKVLRKTHIDEFPQLFNVLRGQMSLIGPRPERPEIVTKLEWEIPCYRERLNVRPGITGLAQVRLPPDTDIESVRRKIIYDVYYVKNVNPWLDCRVLVATGWTLIRELARGAWKRVDLPSAEIVQHGFMQAISDTDYSDSPTSSITDGVPK
jgi:lipopolysaccharide/colanic/teichoic acid biosynthesis glycosyltransferase